LPMEEGERGNRKCSPPVRGGYRKKKEGKGVSGALEFLSSGFRGRKKKKKRPYKKERTSGPGLSLSQKGKGRADRANVDPEEKRKGRLSGGNARADRFYAVSCLALRKRGEPPHGRPR